jgi:hypothetical protein
VINTWSLISREAELRSHETDERFNEFYLLIQYINYSLHQQFLYCWKSNFMSSYSFQLHILISERNSSWEHYIQKKGEKQLIERILQTKINIYRSIRDGTALMQHIENFYYITLLEVCFIYLSNYMLHMYFIVLLVLFNVESVLLRNCWLIRLIDHISSGCMLLLCLFFPFSFVSSFSL